MYARATYEKDDQGIERLTTWRGQSINADIIWKQTSVFDTMTAFLAAQQASTPGVDESTLLRDLWESGHGQRALEKFAGVSRLPDRFGWPRGSLCQISVQQWHRVFYHTQGVTTFGIIVNSLPHLTIHQKNILKKVYETLISITCHSLHTCDIVQLVRTWMYDIGNETLLSLQLGVLVLRAEVEKVTKMYLYLLADNIRDVVAKFDQRG